VYEEKADNLSLGDLKLYIKINDYLQTIGFKIDNQENEDKVFSSYIRCMDFFWITFENLLPLEKFASRRRDIDLLKRIDKRTSTNQIIVELDAFADLMFWTFEELRKDKEKNVADLFQAADI